MTRLSFNLFGLGYWFNGDFERVWRVIAMGDEMGMDQVSAAEHMIMSKNTGPYPYGSYGPPLDFPWHEPMMLLTAVAARTKRLRLSTGILITPIRSAVHLAKQVATLDHLSGGRVDLGVGTGWQREEYDSSNLPFESRLDRLEEQLHVCKTLWTQSPASFHGKYNNFDELMQLPFPPQGGNLPIFFGIAPTEKNIDRIARLGVGWLPMETAPEKLAPVIEALRAAFKAKGRDPAELQVRVSLPAVMNAQGRGDIAATAAGAQALIDIGVTGFDLSPMPFVQGQESEFEHFFKTYLTVKDLKPKR